MFGFRREVFGGVVPRCSVTCRIVVQNCSEVFGVVPGVHGNVLGGVQYSTDEFGASPDERGASPDEFGAAPDEFGASPDEFGRVRISSERRQSHTLQELRRAPTKKRGTPMSPSTSPSQCAQHSGPGRATSNTSRCVCHVVTSIRRRASASAWQANSQRDTAHVVLHNVWVHV
jgi:hypothetical protein